MKRRKRNKDVVQTGLTYEKKPSGRRKETVSIVTDLVMASEKVGKEPTTKNQRYKYSPAFPHLAYRLALLGLTNVQMAVVFNVSARVFQSWLAMHEDLRLAVQRGKESADGAVVESLYRAAVGYEKMEEVILTNRVKTFGENGKLQEEHMEPLRVDVRKYYPPNVKAALAWLRQRQPDVWSSVKRTEIGVQMTVNQINMKDFSVEELEVLEKIGLKGIEDGEAEIEN